MAIPLFILLAQNRSLRIIGQDRGVGSVDARLKPEDRIRVVSDRFDHANRVLIQVDCCLDSQACVSIDTAENTYPCFLLRLG